MRQTVAFVLLLLASVATPSTASTTTTTIWATPHESYSSSIGALGCKLNTNRVAYFPLAPSCSSLCIRLTHASSGRSLALLRIDQSDGAHDVSYDAWNYLVTGASATDAPTTGGAVAMDYEEVDMDECAELIHADGGKLALSASNSMNFLFSCLEGYPDGWLAQNYALYNVLDPICSWGRDELCNIDWGGGANQPTCPSTLGVPAQMGADDTVFNVQYGTGRLVNASDGQVVEDGVGNGSSGRARGAGLGLLGPLLALALGIHLQIT
ncbi:uncharacterized protein BCR38DRAFT_415461 [Pseudomassariella vexata]|uniref:Cerato-platanin n=1 Tax=Pseudomassariella vexata TaxID=1141098 RepID=A0A1Y2EJD7_9PEZI|nr:uncharacterized protein BCR38DRAFT_415461 [Pseudomassariella vexata]ORY70925.1 hypothetical protein BCR38DRAFT_415461 [Pseudomassariella vexata]